jgi:hypothetical protein
MGHAPENVRQAADHITATHDDDGVAQAIERFVLNGLTAADDAAGAVPTAGQRAN